MNALGFPHYATIAVCAASAVSDVRNGRIYNMITIPAMVLGVAYAAFRGGDGALPASLAGLVAGVVPFAVAAWRGWIGGGDVKLFGAIGALAGPLFLFDSLLVAFVLAAGYGLALIVGRAGGVSPAAITRRVWKRLSAPGVAGTTDTPGTLLDRPVRMGVFILAGVIAAAVRVATIQTG